MSTIRTAQEDGILTITLDRPDHLNAFNEQMAIELVDAFTRANVDDAVRAIIVTGAGRCFCAGADLSGGSSAFDYDAQADGASSGSPVQNDGRIDYSHPAVRDRGGDVTLAIFRCLKPVIGAINGHAVGIGITMTLPMDIRLTVEDAKISFPFVRRGIVPESASAWFLPRVVGISKAMEWCVTGRMLTARAALEAGLVRSLHAPEDLLPAAHALALEMTQGTAPVSVALTRQMLWRGLTMADPFEAHRIDSRGVYARGRSGDAREGVGAFLEKREPVFRDRVCADMPDFFPWWTEQDYH